MLIRAPCFVHGVEDRGRLGFDRCDIERRLEQFRAKTESACTGREPRTHLRGIDTADGEHFDISRQHSPQCSQVLRPVRRRREQLQPSGTRVDGLKRLSRRRKAWHYLQSQIECAVNHADIDIRCDDQLATRFVDALHVSHTQHRACADIAIRWEVRTKRCDAREGVRRVEWDFNRSNTGAIQRFSNRPSFPSHPL